MFFGRGLAAKAVTSGSLPGVVPGLRRALLAVSREDPHRDRGLLHGPTGPKFQCSGSWFHRLEPQLSAWKGILSSSSIESGMQKQEPLVGEGGFHNETHPQCPHGISSFLHHNALQTCRVSVQLHYVILDGRLLLYSASAPPPSLIFREHLPLAIWPLEAQRLRRCAVPMAVPAGASPAEHCYPHSLILVIRLLDA